jgi:hypothetical protein
MLFPPYALGKNNFSKFTYKTKGIKAVFLLQSEVKAEKKRHIKIIPLIRCTLNIHIVLFVEREVKSNFLEIPIRSIVYGEM